MKDDRNEHKCTLIRSEHAKMDIYNPYIKLSNIYNQWNTYHKLQTSPTMGFCTSKFLFKKSIFVTVLSAI